MINKINYVRSTPAVVNVVVDTPAVVGVACVDAGANIVVAPATVDGPSTIKGISGANAMIDGGDDGLANLHRTLGTHTANFTALPGHLFSANRTDRLTVTYTIDPQMLRRLKTGQFSYTDDFGARHLRRDPVHDVRLVSCTFNGFTRTPGEHDTHQWMSDFDNTLPLGTLTYTVNAEGTGYTGQVVYPVA